MERLLHVNRLGKFLKSEKITTFWSLSESLNPYPSLLQLRDTISTFRNDALESLPPDKLYLRYNCWEAIQDWTTEQAPNGEQIGVG